ncbi:hypothetical protein [Wocania ichthyoenteri]|uniref:hypothetical protein n=1 Tax=Wocania ichthyoenteri TaxID=1230531 RepID=UPI00053D51CE|nr:hypothetical protein [Wocania ichthyoenteri]
MKQLFYKNILYGAIMLLSLSVFGQSKATKETRKTFPLSDNGALYLNNKYGDVFINGWDKDSIQILVNIEVKGKNFDKAKALLNRITSNIVNTKKQVIVKSEIGERESSFFNKYFNKIDPFKSEKANTNINYTVYLPRYAEVEVFNKYGDIIISGWNGKLIADVEHGDLRITDSITNSKLSVRYGKLRANSLHETNINTKDATVFFDYAKILKLESDGSEINIEKVNELDIDSNKDDLEINTINNVFGKVKYSKVVFNTVTSKVNLNLNLAELRILKLDTESPVVNVQQKSSEVYINISGTSFNFGAELEQGVLRIPKTMYSITSKVLDEKNKIRQIRAIYGKKNKGIFDITGYKGIIIFKEL